MKGQTGVGDDVDGTTERFVTIEVEVSESFKIPFFTFINSLKELSGTIKTWRIRDEK